MTPGDAASDWIMGRRLEYAGHAIDLPSAFDRFHTMKIAAIDTTLLTLPYRTSGGHHFIAGRPSPVLSMLLVRVVTDAGIDGWGEAFGHAVATGTKTVIDTMIAPLLIGRDPRDIAGLMNDAHRKLHIFGRNGPVIYGLSGVDIALWDIAGKLAGQPLYKLLGGTPVDDLPAYASLLRTTGPAAVAQSCSHALEQGYRAIKLHEVDPLAIYAAREAVGPDVALMVDTNCPWSVAQAVDMATALRPLQLHWIEEPVWPPEDYEGLARVRAAGAVIAAGENLCSPHEFRRLFSAKAVDVVQPSVSKVGGVSAMKPIVDLAQTFGVRTVPHCGYLGPGLLATLHVVAALLGDVPVERLDIELEEEPFSELTKVRCGRIALPQGPGLGGVPDKAVLDRCRAL